MTKLRTILLNNDIIEIHYNKNLKHRPYLVRLTNYDNDVYELRLDENDLKELSLLLVNIYESQSQNVR